MHDRLLRSPLHRLWQCAAAVLLAAVVSGCAALEREEVGQTENLLAAAGFQMKPAETPEKLAQLGTMRQHQIIRRLHDGQVMYVYADAQVCNCLYYGTQQQYDRYRRLALQQQIAQERLSAAEMNQNAAMNWGAWGPFGPWY